MSYLFLLCIVIVIVYIVRVNQERWLIDIWRVIYMVNVYYGGLHLMSCVVSFYMKICWGN